MQKRGNCKQFPHPKTLIFCVFCHRHSHALSISQSEILRSLLSKLIPTFTTGRPQRAKAVYIMTQTRPCKLPPRLVEEEIRDESVKNPIPVAVPVLLHTQDILGIVV